MDEYFAFLKNAKPAALFRLLEKLPGEDAVLALAGLPATLSVQVMAYFPEKRQAELMPALREARKADSARAAAAAERIRTLLLEAKNARGDAAASAAPDAPSAPVAGPKISSAPPPPPAASGAPAAPPVRPQRPDIPPVRPADPKAMYSRPGRPSPPNAPVVRPPPPPPRGQAGDVAAASGRPAAKPMPWVPRAAAGSPINGPAVPGKPPPVAGDPLKSPLAGAGLLDILQRAQQKFLPRAKRPARPGARPEPVEGVVPTRSVEVSRTPKVIGPAPKPARPAPKAPAEPEARRMDGKAILAAILREADSGTRENVRRDDPGLFRELRGRMFYFDDLIYTADNDLARVFTAAPASESALALKFAAPALRDRVFRVVSPGRAEALRSVPHGRSGLDDIEAAQKKVLEVALQLQAAGRILIDPRDPDLAG